MENMEMLKVIKIRQNFDQSEINDVASAVAQISARQGLGYKINSGMRIVITVGCRGLDKLPILVKSLVQEVCATDMCSIMIAAKLTNLIYP